MYDIAHYVMMITDRTRTGAYREALRRTIEPGATVVDLGCGSGIFALLACQCGAGHVWAIDTSSAIQVARELARANGYEDRITFLQNRADEVNLPEPVDVLVHDLRGILPLLGTALPDIAAARQRFLKPAGHQIPRRDILHAALVEASDRELALAGGLRNNTWDLTLDPLVPYATSSWYRVVRESPDLQTEPLIWAEIDYRTLTGSDLDGSVTWQVGTPGTAHGLLVWFEADLAEGIGFSCHPRGPETIYGQTFFPFSAPLTLTAGSTVECTLSARLVGNDYVWRWQTGLRAPGTDGRYLQRFDQSSFHGVPITPADLARRRLARAPAVPRGGPSDADAD